MDWVWLIIAAVGAGVGTGFAGLSAATVKVPMMIVLCPSFSGEIKKSMVLLFVMFTLVIAVAWGLLGKPEFAASAILMWGVGDAAAALIGIPFGKHKIRFRFTDGKKSWEGSAAMMIAAMLCGFCVLFLGFDQPLISAIALSMAGALFGTVAEMFTPSEYDTISVPVVILIVLLVLRV